MVLHEWGYCGFKESGAVIREHWLSFSLALIQSHSSDNKKSSFRPAQLALLRIFSHCNTNRKGNLYIFISYCFSVHIGVRWKRVGYKENYLFCWCELKESSAGGIFIKLIGICFSAYRRVIRTLWSSIRFGKNKHCDTPYNALQHMCAMHSSVMSTLIWMVTSWVLVRCDNLKIYLCKH